VPNAGLPASETTIADRLKAAGYRTAVFGKWHRGFTDRLHPMSRGFDEFWAPEAGGRGRNGRGASGALQRPRTPGGRTFSRPPPE
jgi:arylsulfatase A-like enzyme